MVNVCIVTGYGINADEELAEAFRRAGGWVRSHHLNDITANPGLLANYHILGVPGGFSFGDHLDRVRSSRIFSVDTFKASSNRSSPAAVSSSGYATVSRCS